MYFTEESTCDTVWKIWCPRNDLAPHGDSAPKELCPPLDTPALGCMKIGPFFHKFISLMRDDSLERKGSSENRNAIWKAYN